MKLSKYERETIINFNEEEAVRGRDLCGPEILCLRPGAIQRRAAQSGQFPGENGENMPSRQEHTLRK